MTSTGPGSPVDGEAGQVPPPPSPAAPDPADRGRRTVVLAVLAVLVAAAVPTAVVVALPTRPADRSADGAVGGYSYASGPGDALYPFTTYGAIEAWSADADRDRRWSDPGRTAAAFAEEWLGIEDARTTVVPVEQDALAPGVEVVGEGPVDVVVRAASDDRTLTVVRLRPEDDGFDEPVPWLVTGASSVDLVLDEVVPQDPAAVTGAVAVSGSAPAAERLEVVRRHHGQVLPGDVSGPTSAGQWDAELPAGSAVLERLEAAGQDAVVALAYRDGRLYAAAAVRTEGVPLPGS